jgi:hypothetical protein
MHTLIVAGAILCAVVSSAYATCGAEGQATAALRANAWVGPLLAVCVATRRRRDALLSKRIQARLTPLNAVQRSTR